MSSQVHGNHAPAAATERPAMTDRSRHGQRSQNIGHNRSSERGSTIQNIGHIGHRTGPRMTDVTDPLVDDLACAHARNARARTRSTTKTPVTSVIATPTRCPR